MQYPSLLFLICLHLICIRLQVFNIFFFRTFGSQVILIYDVKNKNKSHSLTWTLKRLPTEPSLVCRIEYII